jgi:predicted ATPase/DNA-binding CsgD family transcriptional regulator
MGSLGPEGLCDVQTWSQVEPGTDQTGGALPPTRDNASDSIQVIGEGFALEMTSAQTSLAVRPTRAWRTGRLPIAPGPLIGRDWEMAAIRELVLQEDVRLLTLWGPAGIGKTRLALAVAADEELAQAFKDDIVFVDLAPIREPSNVMPAIAEAFGLGEATGRLLSELESPLQHRQVLLVLDNVEHVLDCAPQLAQLLVSCPSLKVLATSRAALRLRWEHAFPVPPLPVPYRALPTDAETAASYAGVALFVDRARAARPDFQLTDANASVVADLCTRLDGMPLALELAAARTQGLPLLVLLKRLDDRLTLLQSGAPDLPARQQTLRRALTWSYDLLDEAQQKLFRRMAVFVDGCSPEAAEAVCGDQDADVEADVLEGLSILVHHSLVRLDETAMGQARYSMLATIRDYALEHLSRSGEAEEIRGRHVAYYLSLAEEADQQLWGPDQLEWLERLEVEHGNLRAALRWAIVSGEADFGMRLGAALRRFWSIRGHLTEGRSWLRRLLALPQPSHVEPAHARGLAAAAAGWLAEDQGDYGEAASLQEQSLVLCRQVGDEQGIANALHRLAVLAKYADDTATARARFEESLTIFQSLGVSDGTPRVLHDLGALCLDGGDLTRAREYFDHALAIRRGVGDHRGIALALLGLARVALGQGDLAPARAQLEEALSLLRKLGDHQSIASVLEVFACLAARRGGTARALRLVGAAESLRTAVGAHPAPDWRSDLEAYQAATRGELGHAASAAAHAEGRAMVLEDAIQLCLEQETLARASDCPEEVMVNGFLEEFTRREREVIELAVRGWSNRQIANELVISERTAEGHIHNILGKLQLDSRAQLVAWGARLGLVMTEKDLPGRGLAS